MRPGEDFYEFANQNWLNENPIPYDQSRFGTFDILIDETLKKIFTIIKCSAEDPHGKKEDYKKLADFFISGMAIGQINKRGFSPLLPFISVVESIQSIEEVQAQMVVMFKYGLTPVFEIIGAPDQKRRNFNIAHLNQSGLGLPDKSYYIDNTSTILKIRLQYQEHIAYNFRLLHKVGKVAEQMAKDVFSIEQQLAHVSRSRVDLRIPSQNYNKHDFAGLYRICPSFNWSYMIEQIGLDKNAEFNICQPEFFRAASNLMDSISVSAWKSYLLWNWLRFAGPYLSLDFAEADFNFFKRTLSGIKIPEPRWKTVTKTINNLLPDLIGQIFVQNEFSASIKAKATELCEFIRIALENRIKKLAWMEARTKKLAIDKLKSMELKIGYPPKWKTYELVKTSAKDYFENVVSATKNIKKDNLGKIGFPVDPDEWEISPQTVNAYYGPQKNEMVFPAAILQPPFFHPDVNAFVNFGSLGVIFGHEMTHAFDDQGRLYDLEGNLKDWWTPHDSSAFNALKNKMVSFINELSIEPGLQANGALTIGENIADLGGLSIALNALKLYCVDKNIDVNIQSNQLSPIQTFFIAYANVWAQHIRPEEKRKRTKEDVHSLARHRVNAMLVHFDEFYKAFHIRRNDRMYIPVEKRIRIW